MRMFTPSSSFSSLALCLSFSVSFSCSSSSLAADFPGADSLPTRPNLPDPLVSADGTPVTSKSDWFARRRPELKAQFEHYMYGTAPSAPEPFKFTVDRVDPKALGGKATLKEVSIPLGLGETPKLHLLLVVPNDRPAPAPVFLGLSFGGVHTVLDDPAVALPTTPEPESTAKKKAVPNNGRGSQVGVWNAEAVVDRGYALAVISAANVAPDRPGREQGIFPFYPSSFDWGHVAAWAWGLSRAADYLVTDSDLDRSKVAVVGHSRMGKAALLAGAFDDRFALVYAHQAGCGGSAPSRGTGGEPGKYETVKRINASFPHWFNAEFKTFSEQPEKLPFDQNGLVALCAPRPVLFTAAVEDVWANPEGQFLVLKAAEPVYRLLDAGGLESAQPPETNKLVSSTLGYAIRPGKHAMNRDDWSFFLDFADARYGRKPPN